MKVHLVYSRGHEEEKPSMNSLTRKTASFDVDAQKSFTPLCPDELPVPGGDQIAGELNFIASLASLQIGRAHV